MTEQPQDKVEHAREAFRRTLNEFLGMDGSKAGSVTFHFSGGRVRKIEWRTLDDTERWAS